MTSTEFTSDDIAGKPPPRKRGAPKGNRNAWKHGGRSAAAKAVRAESRARIVALLPDAGDLLVSVAMANLAHARLGGVLPNAPASPYKTNNSVQAPQRGEGGTVFSPNKTNNSIHAAQRGEGGGDFSPNKTNNSVAREAPRSRGAPKGNKNALKHGMKSAERRAFKSGLRLFLCRVKASCALAHREAERRERDGEIVAARGPPKVAARNRVAIVRGPPG